MHPNQMSFFLFFFCFFFFSSRRRHTRFDCDWSSDVCSSDLWIYVVGMLALNVVIGVMALYFKDVYGVTEETIGYFFTIFGVVGVLMRFEIGRASCRERV